MIVPLTVSIETKYEGTPAADVIAQVAGEAVQRALLSLPGVRQVEVSAGLQLSLDGTPNDLASAPSE